MENFKNYRMFKFINFLINILIRYKMFNIYKLMIFTILVFLAPYQTHCATATPYSVDSYPDISTDMKACGRSGKNSSAICDPDNIVSISTRDQVDGILYNIYTSTSSPCDYEGFKVVFTLMNTITD